MTITQPDSVTLRAGCKINLHLEITGVREDGYHELDTLFFPLQEPFDTITIAKGSAGTGLILNCPALSIPPEKNIIYKSWEKFGAATGWKPDLKISVEKGIPDGAGLGGGSSDAAVVLNYLNKYCPNNALSADALNKLAATIGADVPFFLNNVPAHATGIGDVLTPSDITLEGYSLVLICPDVSISTPWAFAAWDKAMLQEPSCNNKKEFLTTATSKDRKHSSRALWLFNSFEVVVYSAFPKLRAYKDKLIEFGAVGAVMSGSGSSIFALYREMEQAARAATALKAEGVATYLHHL
ncbi:4-(cytidine 5'-diphospho)-2-C-methyl-D-erythritol kinase [Halodesulfovibrio marinisediminis]|uniref:4-diphosphocytidyl-2-C-methyl-D-erythritol kinase n=1 Tax=Halodesulfovibrio marinisediminis DSM 17456 TaxID=1121457 RepID=A0A1N6E322_9BACT|nr:4-(cytidine 5'-diphospho)-2-C-methyl-D-erythritol kinase [Halodesulfovibrio marinisediminis]SIN77418.1 4-diphosphocytidyl-2-C-methyl-D-erythritol kinase [Halodesulfovibrio marinisediminis DSM 17456]